MIITHMFYMADLKTYTKSDKDQKGLLTIIKGFSDDIGIKFGLGKCAKATFQRSRLTSMENIKLDIDSTIQDQEQEGSYKYLGVNEGDGI